MAVSISDDEYAELLRARAAGPRQGSTAGRIVAGVLWTILLLAATIGVVGITYQVWHEPVQAFLTPPVVAPTTAAHSGTNAVPTPYVAPIDAVVPQETYHTLPTVAAIPTEIAPAVLSQGATAYALITTPPTPYPTPVCDASHAAFTTEQVRVLDTKGIPIGEVQGWSCNSEAEAVASVRALSEAMIAQHKGTP